MLNVPLCPERNVTPMECTPCAPRVITKSTWSGQGDLTTSLQCVIKLMSHADDAICHCFQLYCPICKKIPVPKSKKLINEFKDATPSPLPGTTNGIKKQTKPLKGAQLNLFHKLSQSRRIKIW